MRILILAALAAMIGGTASAQSTSELDVEIAKLNARLAVFEIHDRWEIARDVSDECRKEGEDIRHIASCLMQMIQVDPRATPKPVKTLPFPPGGETLLDLIGKKESRSLAIDTRAHCEGPDAEGTFTECVRNVAETLGIETRSLSAVCEETVKDIPKEAEFVTVERCVALILTLDAAIKNFDKDADFRLGN